MLLAEGAVDIAAEPELELHDMAALDVIVREAGGRFTSLAGTDGPFGGNALATNGHLHEAALSFLGSLPTTTATPTGAAPGPARCRDLRRPERRPGCETPTRGVRPASRLFATRRLVPSRHRTVPGGRDEDRRSAQGQAQPRRHHHQPRTPASAS